MDSVLSAEVLGVLNSGTGFASRVSGILLFTIIASDADNLITSTTSLGMIQTIGDRGRGGFAKRLSGGGSDLEDLTGWAVETGSSVNGTGLMFTVRVNSGGWEFSSLTLDLTGTVISAQGSETFSGVSIIEASVTFTVGIGFHTHILTNWSRGEDLGALASSTVEEASVSAFKAFRRGEIGRAHV